MLDEQLEVAKTNAALSDSTVGILLLQQEAGQVTALATQQAQAQQLAATQLIRNWSRTYKCRKMLKHINR